MIRMILLLALTATLGVMAPAQNEIAHHDGTSEFSSRGAQLGAATTLMQRFPADQLCGTSTIVEIVTTFTDWNTGTPEMATVEIRRNDPTGPPTGRPDMTPAGLIATTGSVPVPVAPGTGMAASARLVFPLVVPLAPGSPVGPAGDLYVAWTLPASPAWPNDGLAIHISSSQGGNAGEQMSPNATGYSGVVGQAGLGWQSNPNTGAPPAAMPGDGAFAIGLRFAEDVLQPFADNPSVFTGSTWVPAGTGTGQNPNFGYAGIFPDMMRAGGPDGVGVRLRATAPGGSVSQLYVGTGVLSTPIVVLPGFVCVDPSSMLGGPYMPWTSGFTQAAAGLPPGTSEVVFGPFPGNASFVGFDLHAQCLTVNALTGGLRVSALATIHL